MLVFFRDPSLYFSFLNGPNIVTFFVKFERKRKKIKYPWLSPALRRPEFIDQSFLPKKLRSLDIFKKKKKVTSLNVLYPV